MIDSVQFIRALIFVLALTTFSAKPYATPWIQVGDERARHHLQFLKDSGAISLPLTTWPVSWADVSRELSDIQLDELNDQQLWSYRFLRHAREQADRPIKTTKIFYGSNSIIPFSSFQANSREEVYASSETSILSGSLAFNISAQAIRHPTDEKEVRYDHSFIAGTINNWTIGVGAIDRWWGPGWQSSLILSNNARPSPGFFIRRTESSPSETKYLSLFGPWTFEAFVNELEAERSVPNARLVGARASISPLKFFELSYSQTSISSGETPTTPTGIAPNNLDYKALDMRVHLPSQRINTAIYGQVLNKDSNTSKSAMMAGIELSFSTGFAHNRVGIEISDTKLDDDNHGLYDHDYYTSGYRYWGRPIGESAGENAKKAILTGSHYFDFGHQLNWKVGKIQLNENQTLNNVYSTDTEDHDYAELSYKIPLSKVALIDAGVFYISENIRLRETLFQASREVTSGAYVQIEIRL